MSDISKYVAYGNAILAEIPAAERAAHALSFAGNDMPMADRAAIIKAFMCPEPEPDPPSRRWRVTVTAYMADSTDVEVDAVSEEEAVRLVKRWAQRGDVDFANPSINEVIVDQVEAIT